MIFIVERGIDIGVRFTGKIWQRYKFLWKLEESFCAVEAGKMKKILLFCLEMGESQYQVEDVTLRVLNSQKVFFYKCERTKTPENIYLLQNFLS